MSPTGTFSQRIAEPRVLEAVHLATLKKVDARAAGMAALRDPEALRRCAERIKQHALDNLPDYLEQFATHVEARGGHVHFAQDGAAARRIICDIAQRSGSKLAVKAKSMTSEEIHLNEALESTGVRTVETDLGEFIVQIDRDRPSHIVTPIIHKDRREVARAMQRELGCEYTEDPRALTGIARKHLRDVFRRCDLGITGVNFAVAETGTICLCTNEGNERMTITRPRVHVALMGIEKLLPRMADLGVFLKLLARASTGQPLTVYTTLIDGPRRADEPDGPEELHVVLMDAGRSDVWAGDYREVLRCIRCGACLNACPVYRNAGGHAYDSVYPGPIGSLVTPLLQGKDRHAELPRASSLCGACFVACPVRIDIPHYLVKLRQDTRSTSPWSKRVAMRAWSWFMGSVGRYRFAQWLARRLLGKGDAGFLKSAPGPAKGWTETRDLLVPAARSFRALWRDELRCAGQDGPRNTAASGELRDGR